MNCDYCGKPTEFREIRVMDTKTGFNVCVNDKCFGEPTKTPDISNTGLSGRLLDETMDDWTHDPNTKPLFVKYEDWKCNIHDYIKKGKSLLISGHYGTGKTKVATTLFKKAVSEGIPAYYINSADLKMNMKLWQSDAQEHKKGVNRLKSTTLLFWDDLGQSTLPEWHSEIYYQILNHRLNNYKSTFFTTHYNQEELAKIIGGECVSRIVEMCEGGIIKVNTKTDYRSKSL